MREGIEENLEVIILGIQFSDPDLKQESSEYDPAMLSIQPRRSLLENAAVTDTKCTACGIVIYI